MKYNNKTLLGLFLGMLFMTELAMATGPRVTQSMLVETENEMYAVDAPPFVSLDVAENGLSASIVNAALKAVETKATLTIFPVTKMVTYYLNEEQALAVYDEYISFSEDEKKSLIYVPVFYAKESYIYSKLRYKEGLNGQGSLSDLSGLKYGTHRSEKQARSIYEEAGIELVFARHYALFNKLVAGEVDFIKMPDLAISWMLEHDNSVQKEHFSTMDISTQLVPKFIVFNKNNPDGEKMAQKLKQGLSIILENGQYAELLKKYLHEDDVNERVKSLTQSLQP